MNRIKELEEQNIRYQHIAKFLWEHMATLEEDDDQYQELAKELRDVVAKIKVIQHDIKEFDVQ